MGRFLKTRRCALLIPSHTSHDLILARRGHAQFPPVLQQVRFLGLIGTSVSCRSSFLYFALQVFTASQLLFVSTIKYLNDCVSRSVARLVVSVLLQNGHRLIFFMILQTDHVSSRMQRRTCYSSVLSIAVCSNFLGP